MGSRVEWVHVLLTAVFFGGFMFIVPRWLGMTPFGKSLKYAIPGAIFSGLLFGLMDTFGFRLLQWPLALLTIMFSVALISMRLLLRRHGRASGVHLR